MTQEQIEAVRAEVAGWIDAAKIMQRERDEAKAQLATLRAAVDEAVSELENLDETFDYAAFCRALDTLRNLTKPVDDRALTASPVDDSETAETVIKPEGDPLVEADAKAMAQSVDNAVAQLAADAIRSAFMVSVSGDEKPYRYHLRLAYPTMEAMHEAEDRLRQFVARDRFKPLSARGGRVVFDQPETPSARIMSDKDRENPVEGAHPTQPEGEDALVEALREVLPTHNREVGKLWAANLRKALASRGLVVRGEGVA